MTLLDNAERKRIADAITAVEQTTSGEIVTVVAARSASYLHVPFLWAAAAALIVPWPLIYWTWWPVQWIFATQLAVFLTLLLALSPPSLRLALVPASTRRANAHRRAVEQFLALNMTNTEGRTGVMIFVSLAERYAEVIPDKAIAALVPAADWQGLIDTLTADIGAEKTADGFVRAIETAGAHLAKHFPPGSANANELPNHLIVLA